MIKLGILLLYMLCWIFFPAGIVQVWNYWGVVIYWNLNQRFDRCSTSMPIIEWIYQRQGPKGINRMCIFGEHMLEATFLGAISITFKMQWRSFKTTQLTPEWPISKAGPRWRSWWDQASQRLGLLECFGIRLQVVIFVWWNFHCATEPIKRASQ